MKRYEYKKVEISLDDDYITILNREGKEGWELIHVFPDYESNFLLKREKEDETD